MVEPFDDSAIATPPCDSAASNSKGLLVQLAVGGVRLFSPFCSFLRRRRILKMMAAIMRTPVAATTIRSDARSPGSNTSTNTDAMRYQTKSPV